MTPTKIIYWRADMQPHDEDAFANVHIIIGDNNRTITDFKNMADELRETFPQATNDKIRGGKISESSSYDGHTIIAWNAKIPRGEYPGWTQKEKEEPPYTW